MKKFCFVMIVNVSLILAQELSISADVVSRYVWRGTDFGNAAALQPSLSYQKKSLEIGAWGSWSVNGAAGGNENDLYVAYSLKNMTFTLSDYFFPEYTKDDKIDEFGKNGGHIFEVSMGIEYEKITLLAAVNVMGADSDNSKYFEVGYSLLSKNEMKASLFLGVGDYIYAVEDEFALVNVGFSVAKGAYSAAYIINPDQKTSFLTFAISIE